MMLMLDMLGLSDLSNTTIRILFRRLIPTYFSLRIKLKLKAKTTSKAKHARETLLVSWINSFTNAFKSLTCIKS